MTAFTFDNAQLNLQGVTQITVSSIQPDTNSTQYVRMIQIYDTDPTQANARPCLTLMLYGGNQTTLDQSELQVQTPALEF